MDSLQRSSQTYYRLPFALRHGLKIDPLVGAHSLVSLMAQDKHISSEDIPFITNHDAFHRFILRLHDFMTVAWWSRQWVIQEIVLPLEVTLHYDNIVARWEMFAHAARNYEQHRTSCCDTHCTKLHWNDFRLLEHFSRTIFELDELRRKWQHIRKNESRSPSINLRSLLWQFRGRDTSDARDKVYTLLPLVNHWGRHMPIYPNYNWTAQQVYRATLEKIILMDDSLLVLCGNMEQNLPGLPSWVPDWTRKPSKFELERLERTHLFSASGGRKPEVRFINQDLAAFEGLRFDEIIAVSSTMDYQDEDVTHDIFATWYTFVSQGTSGEDTRSLTRQ